jgi:cytochrome c-type biogenesis protein CcmE
MTAPPQEEQKSLFLTTMRPKKAGSNRFRLIGAGLILTAFFILLLYQGFTHSIVYFRTASQAVAERQSLSTSTFQIEGTVVGNTIKYEGLNIYFEISSGKTRLPVIFKGPAPQLFQPGIPVVLVGNFAKGTGPGNTSLTFLSSQMMIKHTSTYIAKYPNRVKASNGKSH